MENLIQKELYSNALKFIERNENQYSPSYKELQLKALEYFNQESIPTKKNENWIYTNISKHLSHRFENEESIGRYDEKFVLNKNAVIVFNNGIFNRDKSILPKGLTKISPTSTSNYHDVFDALNFAISIDSIGINVEKNTSLDYPITILHLSDEATLNKINSPRIHFNIAENCQLKFIEIFTSTQNELYQYTTNAHTQFTIGSNSKVTHIKLDLEAKQSTHIGITKADINRDATFRSFVIDMGHAVSRHNVDVHLNAENSTADVHGVYNLKNSEHADVFTTINHHASHTYSDQVYKGVMNHTSHGTFTGKVIIDENAILVNSSQLNKNLLLSKKAHINTRPQLLVSADDVKCAHGATVGELSSEEEFYLTSRGISKAKARKMLALGFINEIILKIEDIQIQNFLLQFFAEENF